MNRVLLCVSVLAAIVAASCALADTITKPWTVSATVGGVYTDNRDGLRSNKEANLDLTAEPRLSYRLTAEQGQLDFYVAPALKWHSNPRSSSEGSPQNDAELFGGIGLDGLYRIVPRVQVKLGESFLYTDDPGIDEGGATVRTNGSFYLNNAYAEVGAELTPKFIGSLNGRVINKRYTEDSVANYEDEDTLSSEANLKYMMGSGYALSGFVGASLFDNESPTVDRGSTVYDVGAGVEKTFTPDFWAKLSAGYANADYENENLDSLDTVLGRGEVVLRAASPTRFRVSGMHGFYAPYVRPYSVQRLTSVAGSVEHDFTQQITLAANAQYTQGHYKNEGTAETPGGDDRLATAGVRGYYRFSRNLSAGLGYTFEHWDSEVRESFNRNTVDVSLKAEM